jgi:flagellar basal-body rod modification protein FlgD
MASAINPVGSASQNYAQAASAAVPGAPSEEMFLQLLVTQIKNQDPMNPSDSTQFVSQLAQFSQLEQVIAIRKDIESAATPASTPASSTTQV